MDKQQFLQDVEHEVRMLKEHATPKERSRLDFETFNSGKPEECIYGQMTGSCESSRAKELMKLACVRVFDLTTLSNANILCGDNIDDKFLSVVNGPYEEQTWNEDSISPRSYKYLSVLEGYIMNRMANIPRIMAFLKDETEDLEI